MHTGKKRALDKVAAVAMKHGETSYLGQICRTWLYQPRVPQKLIDMDK